MKCGHGETDRDDHTVPKGTPPHPRQDSTSGTKKKVCLGQKKRDEHDEAEGGKLHSE